MMHGDIVPGDYCATSGAWRRQRSPQGSWSDAVRHGLTDDREAMPNQQRGMGLGFGYHRDAVLAGDIDFESEHGGSSFSVASVG